MYVDANENDISQHEVMHLMVSLLWLDEIFQHVSEAVLSLCFLLVCAHLPDTSEHDCICVIVRLEII